FGCQPETLLILSLTASESEADDRGGSKQHPASSNVKTARSWRGILPFTHLAREGRMTVTIGRRELLAALGAAAAAWPLAVRAQQPGMPVIGFIDPRSPEAVTDRLRGFRQGLKEAGFLEGENVAIVYRYAEKQLDRLPELVADLIRRPIAVLATGGAPAAFAAKAATTTIPVVFLMGDDPVRVGLVASLARPGGNLTGINLFIAELATKRLELLRELVPGASRIAVLVNPADRPLTENQLAELKAGALAMGLQIQVFSANAIREIDAVFETMGRERPDALFVAATPF